MLNTILTNIKNPSKTDTWLPTNPPTHTQTTNYFIKTEENAKQQKTKVLNQIEKG